MGDRVSGHPPFIRGMTVKRGLPTGSAGLCNRPAPTNRSHRPWSDKPGVFATPARAGCATRFLLGTMPGTAAPGPRGDHRESNLRTPHPDQSGKRSAGPGRCRPFPV
jgi:hypothetical protein